MVLILSMLTALQTALDYAEPTQRALLVERIRPVRPLIRNTPYGKRIQNKLQREQMDHFGWRRRLQQPAELSAITAWTSIMALLVQALVTFLRQSKTAPRLMFTALIMAYTLQVDYKAKYPLVRPIWHRICTTYNRHPLMATFCKAILATTRACLIPLHMAMGFLEYQFGGVAPNAGSLNIGCSGSCHHFSQHAQRTNRSEDGLPVNLGAGNFCLILA
jgi:hypothetical protein